MVASHSLVVVLAVAIHMLVSPIPEVSTELYVLPYIVANTLLGFYLWSQSLGVPGLLMSMVHANWVFLLTSTLLTVTRRLLFSPLTRFPGPRLAAVSALWNANEARLGRLSRTHKALHERYQSDIVRIGPNELSINNVDAIEKLYRGKYLRGTFNQVFNIGGADVVATLRDDKKHSAWRRILAKAFTRVEVLHLAKRLQTHIDKTVQILHKQGSSSLDCGRLFDALTFDAISDIAFSYDGGLQEGHGDPTALRFIHKFLKISAFVGHLPHLQQILRYLPPPPEGKFFGRLGDKIFNAHQSLEEPPRDIISHLLAADRETGTALSPREVKEHIVFFLHVGAHSVSTTLTCIFAALASRPDIQTLLREEARGAMDADGILSAEAAGRLKLLDNVIKEGLRLFGPLQGGTPAIVPQGGVVLDTGEFLPEYTQVYIGQYTLAMQERYFARPAEFLPERWMPQDAGGGGSPLVKDRRAWIPFGYGVHACGGRALALEELKLVVVRLVAEFEVSFPQGPGFDFDDWVGGIKDHFLTFTEAIKLRFVAAARA